MSTERLDLYPTTVEVARQIVAGDHTGIVAAPGWPHADTLDAFRPFAEHGGPGEVGPWLVVLRDTGQVIGECGWKQPVGEETEIGYGFAPAYRGRGYGTEAVGKLVDLLRSFPTVARVVAEAEVTNVASRRLLERLGFTVASTEGATVRYVRPCTADLSRTDN